ncbi:MAG: helix-turn-helix domain-containing protein [Brachybacterium sp.]|nr:helix-turn-helix domain-containing protein [Brachybacterium sp.]
MPRPARPMDPRRREALLTVAAEAFLREGYDAASMNEILRVAGVAKSSVYHYIGDKRAVFEATLEDRLTLLRAHAALPDPQSLASSTFWPAVAALLEALTAASEADPRTLQAGRLLHLADAPPVPALAAVREMLTDWARRMLERGRSLGVVDVAMDAEVQLRLAATVAIEMDRMALADGASAATHDLALEVLQRLLTPRPFV